MRHRLLTNLAELISSKPWWSGLIILGVTIILSVLASQLSLTMSMTNLMPQDDPMVVEFDKIMEEYAGAASMLIVAEGDEDRIISFANHVAPKIEILDQWVKKVDYSFPREMFADHALMLMKASELENNRTLFENPNLVGFLHNLNDSFEREYIQSDDNISGQEQERGSIRFMDGVQTFVGILNNVLEGQITGAGEAASDAILFGDIYYRSWDRQMLIMQIIPTFSFLDMDKVIAATNAIEVIVRDYADHYGIRAGLTGVIPLSRDEMAAIQNDSLIITIVALIGILILFIVAFRMFVSPVLAIFTLIIGIIWAMGLAWPLVGQLNMMTSMMGVVLIGLGIDFSIHILSVYTELRARGENVSVALRTTLQKSGMGIFTGGFTTAAAFLTMVISKTAGMREFGLVLGVGIIMTMLAALTVLPTLLVIRERIWGKIRKQPERIVSKDISYRFLGLLANNLARHFGLALAVIIVIITYLGYHGLNITMDYNYLNMEPEGLESIELQDRIIDKLDLSSDYAYITATTLDEAHRITEAAKDMSTSGMVQSIVDFLPSENEQQKRREIVGRIHAAMQASPIIDTFTQFDYEAFKEEIKRLEMNVMEIQDMAIVGGQDKVYLKSGLLVGIEPEEEDETLISLQKELERALENRSGGGLNQPDIFNGVLSLVVARLENSGQEVINNLSLFQRQFANVFKPAVLRMANTESITLESLPQNIRNQYVGKSGDSYLISVFPKGNVWDQLFLERFAAELNEISPRATGLPPVYLRLIKLFAHDGKIATGLALIVIFLLLLSDFKSLRKTILAVIPLVIGAIWMLGVMELSGLQITMVNIMAIPLIIGIGIDDGVHLIHRYQIEGRNNHKTVFASTGRAVLLTSLTTMLGFGSLWFATYRGLGSMGIALFIGVGTCFMASVLIIPIVLGILNKENGE